MAHGSLLEVETQLLLANRLQYLDPSRLDDCLQASAEIGRILYGLIHKLNDRLNHEQH